MTLDGLARSRRIVVCCGTGGVGKTTAAAALAVEGARQGRQTIVVTIDPARRLADALGLAVAIEHRGQGGQIKIKYKSLEQLDEVIRRLEA